MDTVPSEGEKAADMGNPEDWHARFLAAIPHTASRDEAARALARLASAPWGPGPAQLREAGDRLFRRSRTPFGGVLAHLACIAGDLMQLRGELCVRLVLGGTPDKSRVA